MTCIKRSIAVVTVLAFGLLGASSALAAKPTHETTTFPPDELPAGIACEGFAVQFSSQTARVTTFFDRQGNPIRIWLGGASSVTVTNGDTGRSITIPHGGAFHITLNPDGSQTLVTTGHTLLIQFPTDVPAGPSMTLYSGRTVSSVSPDDVYTTISTSGKPPVDICAELSG